jgi:hypothetical protein
MQRQKGECGHGKGYRLAVAVGPQVHAKGECMQGGARNPPPIDLDKKNRPIVDVHFSY